MDIVIGFGEKHNVEKLRASVLGWPEGVDHEDDTLPNARHLVAVTRDGSVVGAVSCGRVAFPNGNGANFGDLRALRFWGLAVDQRYRHTGVGSQLMGALVELASDLDVRILWGYSRVDAVPFYEKLQFGAYDSQQVSALSGLPQKRVAVDLHTISVA